MKRNKSPCIDICQFTGKTHGVLVVEEHLMSAKNGKNLNLLQLRDFAEI